MSSSPTQNEGSEMPSVAPSMSTAVEPARAARRGQDAGADAQAGLPAAIAAEGQLQGGGKAIGDLDDDGAAAADRGAQVAVQHDWP